METIFILVVIGFTAFAIFSAYRSSAKKKQLAFIQDYPFSPSLSIKLTEKYPHLTAENTSLVFDALRDYFLFCNRAQKRMVSMPSQVVDVAWHEFILFTRDYERFCNYAFKRFLHHTPTEAMKTKTLAQDGIKRAWKFACAKENIDPKRPHRLPLIFAIDSLLRIEDGFKYSLNCSNKNSPDYGDGYCASHIGCGGGCSGSSASCGADGCGGDGCVGGCGGGCGGD